MVTGFHLFPSLNMDAQGRHEERVLLTSSVLPPTTNISSRKYYKPWILRSPSLLFLLAITLTLIGLVEYAFHVLPRAGRNGTLEAIENPTSGVSYNRKRQDDGYCVTVSTLTYGSEATLTVTYSEPSCSLNEPGAPPPQYWLPVGTVTLFQGETTPSTTIVTLPSTTITQVTTPSPEPLVYVFVIGNYFVGAFLPTVIAVIFSIPWLIIDAKVRKLEPFHQLAKNNGASGGKTICADYSSQITAPFKALLAGHWTTVLTSMLTLAALLITPLAPETVSIRTEGPCSATTVGCVPSLSIYPPAGRLVQALLCMMALITIILAIKMHRYSTGVFTEPFSIAGLATLFHNQQIFNDIRQVRGRSKKELTKHLAKGWYKLAFYTDCDGSMKYGIVPRHVSTGSPMTTPKIESTYTQEAVVLAIQKNVQFNRPHLVGAIGFVCFLLGLLAVIIYYRLRNNGDGFERFMDSQGFGVKFLFTLIGVLVKLYWGSIFKGVAELEPYNNLANRNANAKKSLLISSSSLPLTAIPSATLQGRIFVALIASTAVLADILTVTLSNIQFQTQTTWTAFNVCTWLSCSIIAVMLVALVALIFRREPKLTAKTSTIAGVLELLCWSSIPRRLGGMAVLGERVRNRRIAEMELRYGIGVVGYEGIQEVVGIEVEQL